MTDAAGDPAPPGLGETGDGLGTLPEDLLLLAFGPRRGLGGGGDAGRPLDFGLAAAQLVQLAALGRVAMSGDRLVVVSSAPTGDGELDATLAELGRRPRPGMPADWAATDWARRGRTTDAPRAPPSTVPGARSLARAPRA